MTRDRLALRFTASLLWGATYVAHVRHDDAVWVGMLLASAVVATLAWLECALHSL